MGCISRIDNHWTKHNTMRALGLLLLCTLVMIGVATAETIRTMNTLAIIALSLSVIGVLHLAVDLLILTRTTLNRVYIAILYSILTICWISISGVDVVEIESLSDPRGVFNLKVGFNQVGCDSRNRTFNSSPGEPYVTHCRLPVIRCSVSWSMVVLYLVASVYVVKEKKRPVKMFGRSKGQGSDEVEEPVADPPPGEYPSRVVRAVIREQDGEMPKTSLDQDYSGGDLEKVFIQYLKT